MQMIAAIVAIIFSGSSLLAGVRAVPQGQPIKEFLEICTGIDFTGDCTNVVVGGGVNVCAPFPDNYQGNVSSAYPPENWTCTLFIDYPCEQTYGSLVITGPESSFPFEEHGFNSAWCNPDN